MEIRVSAGLSPTEDPERVRQAVLNLFPDAVDSGTDADVLVMRSVNLRPLFRRISEQKIRDTARSVLLRSARGNIIAFSLNRQAAYCGRVNFTEGEGALGNLDVEFETDDPEDYVKSMLGGSE